MSEVVLRVAAKAVIVNNEGKVLVLREAKTYKEGTNIGKWGVPGGRLNSGESYQDALLREVTEETGLVVDVGGPVFVGEWKPVIKDIQYQIIGIYSECSVLSGEINLSSEHDAYRWIGLDDIEEITIMPSDIDAVRASLKQRSISND